MGRVCADKNCNTGSAADKKRRKELNLKTPGFFKVPQVSPTQRQEWINSLSTELNSRQYVCDLHFPENSIQHSYVTNLPDGKINKIAQARITRIFNSIPLIVDPPQCTTINYSDVQVLNKRIELQGKEYQQCQHQQEQFQQQEKQQNEFQQQEEQSDDNFLREKDYLRAPVKRKLIHPDENMTIKRVKHSEHSIDYNDEVSHN